MFNRKPKALLDFETEPDIKVSGTFKDYYMLLNKRLKYLQNILQWFKSKCLAMVNKDCKNFQYNSGDLVYIISPLTSQLRTASRKVTIKYVGCRSFCHLQNSRSPQLSADDIRQKNTERLVQA